MTSKVLFHPFTFCLLLIICGLAQVVVANGSCQLYGHSCLGGHGKRSANNAVDSPTAAVVDRSASGQSPLDSSIVSSVNGGLTEEDDSLPLDVQAQLALKERLDMLSNNLARQVKRIQQYRSLKRMEPLLALLAPEELRKRAATLAELKKRRDYSIDSDPSSSINQLL